MSGFDKLKEEVIGTGLCTACGTCIGICPNKTLSFNWEAEVPQATRECPEGCHFCKQACQEACPIHTDVPGYVSLIACGKFQEAFELIRKDNPLPSVCGRVCTHPCEDACNRGQIDDALAITSLKRFVTDYVNIEKMQIPQITKLGKKVAIIGSGPAGLTAANDLALKGYDVTIFEALPEAGGMLRVGIPDYRLPKDILRRDIGYIQKLGVEIKLNTRIGERIKLTDLQKTYDAIFVATGAHLGQKLGVAGEDARGVIDGVRFLYDVNMGNQDSIGTRVVVVGGGNVAMDVAMTSLRLGAKDVQIVCLESQDNMPAFKWEILAATSEGVGFNVSWGVKGITTNNGRVKGIDLIRCTSVFDKSGMFCPAFNESITTSIPADTVIVAIGQTPDLSFLEKDFKIQITTSGLILNDKNTLMTSVPGIFAGGDVISGSNSVIDAMAVGKKVASSMDRYIRGQGIADEELARTPERLTEKEIADIKSVLPSRKRLVPVQLRPDERVKNFREIEQTFSVEQAQEEACRCLSAQGEELCYKVCPGKDIPRPEMDQFIFGRQRNADEEIIGINRGFVKAYATDPVIRCRAASGGVISALLVYALENNIIDAAIVTGVSKEAPWRATPLIATNKQEVLASSTTKTTLCPTNSVLTEAWERGYKRLGTVGVPCQVEAIRKMQMHGKPAPLLGSIKFVLGIFCGLGRHGMMPEHVIEELLDVPLEDVVEAVLHGHQYPGHYAVRTKYGKVIAYPDLGRKLHTDAFIPDRCAVCYDYHSEFADISAGGYFGREAMKGLSGISCLVIRTETGEKLLKDAEAAGYVYTEQTDRSKYFFGGFEGKKHGSLHNIVERRKFGRPTPDYHVPIDYPVPVLKKKF